MDSRFRMRISNVERIFIPLLLIIIMLAISCIEDDPVGSSGSDDIGGSNLSSLPGFTGTAFNPTQDTDIHLDKADSPMNNKNSTMAESTPAPHLILESGTYPYGTQIAISCPDPQASIYYTVDGTIPNETSKLYRAPLKLSRQMPLINIRVFAKTRMKKPSAEVSARYSLLPGIIIHFKKPDNWSTAYVHYWNTAPDNMESKWPGVPMAPEGNGWYYITLKNQTKANLVFNNNGQPQTENLQLTLSEGWYKDGDWWDISPERFNQFAFPDGKWKALVMSYDDGNTQDRRLVKIFNTYKLKGTFHLNSGFLGNSDKISADEVKTLYAGHEVTGHTVTHPYLSSLSEENIKHEILDDKLALENLVGYSVRGFSYPFGDYNQTVLNLLPSLGITYARVVPATNDLRLPNNLLLWRGSGHHTNAEYLGDQLLKWNKEEMALLFIWGHSWELDQNYPNNSWSYIENFCQKVSGHNDIWYATASQVADYLNAIRNLEFSPLGDEIFNPSNTLTVWMKLNNGFVEIKPQRTYKF